MRLLGGLKNAPSAYAYQGASSYDSSDRKHILLAYDLLRALGGAGSVSLGFGLCSFLEADIGLHLVSGSFTATTSDAGADWDETWEADATDGALLLTRAWAGLRLVPLPAKSIRPLLSAGIARASGGRIDDEQLPGEDLPTLIGPRQLGPRAGAGLEIRLGEHVDLLFEVPVFLPLRTVEPSYESSLAGDADQDVALEPVVPAHALQGPELWIVDFLLGLQLRIGGGAREEGATFHPKPI